jgi:hypothetical protein
MRRSHELLLAGYLLARRTRADGSPPSALGCFGWNETYDRFAHLAGGRRKETFRNSLRNTRDQADALCPNSRRGWHYPDGTPAVGPALADLHKRLSSHSDAELDAMLRRLADARSPARDGPDVSG